MEYDAWHWRDPDGALCILSGDVAGLTAHWKDEFYEERIGHGRG
jgi:hypothetical protein